MKRLKISVIIVVGIVCTLAARTELTRAGKPTKSPWDPDKTKSYLDGRATWWLGWGTAARGGNTVCVSCHTAVPYLLVRPALNAVGKASEHDAETQLLRSV